MSFTGIIKKRIDAKGRLSIPKKLRDQLMPDSQGEVMLLMIDGCLELYPARMWRHIQEKMENLSPFDQRTRRLQRFWGMRTDEVSMDSEGRISLTRDQKQYAGISDEVAIIGAMNKVEIWGIEKYRELIEREPDVEVMANEIALL